MNEPLFWLSLAALAVVVIVICVGYAEWSAWAQQKSRDETAALRREEYLAAQAQRGRRLRALRNPTGERREP
jgi:hypothetical protein